jgi:hypothetical protein
MHEADKKRLFTVILWAGSRGNKEGSTLRAQKYSVILDDSILTKAS